MSGAAPNGRRPRVVADMLARFVADLVAPAEPSLSAEERLAVEDRLDRHDTTLNRALARGALFLNLAAPGLEVFFARPRALPVLIPLHVAIVSLLWVWFRVRDPRHWLRPAIGGAIYVATLVVFGYLLRLSLAEPVPYASQTYIGWSTLVAIMLMCTLLPPTRRMALAMPSLCLAVSAWVWSGQTDGHKMVIVSGLTLTLVAFARYALHVRARADAVFEEAAKKWSIASARARSERELELAREVQDSMLPAGTVRLGRLEASFFLARHASVGGDWLAARALADGRVAVLICDAAGKGAQAAVVIHAVQSLWAQALHREDFDCRAWIERVNRSLKSIGRSGAQAVTLGLALVDTRSVTYFNAGHVPMYVVPRGAAPEGVVKLAPRGDMLGIVGRVTIGEARHDFPPGFEGVLLLATDGVLAHRRQQTPAAVAQLAAEVESRGLTALLALETEDDKALALLRVPAA